MINFCNVTSCQTDLVTVGAVTVGCTECDFSLRQFSSHGIVDRNQRIGCTGYTHGLINIGTTRQRVTNGTAQTGCCTAERFNFGWVVVCFVLEHQNPVFCSAVYVNGDLDGTCVDFFAFIQILQLSVCL